METNHIDNRGDQAIQQKAKRWAWITGLTVPVLYILVTGSSTAHAGLGGLAVLLLVYLPLTPICAVFLRFLLTPIYSKLLDKDERSHKRKFMGSILVLLAVSYAILLAKSIPSSNSTVKRAVEDIYVIESYFYEHKEELETMRLEMNGGEKWFSETFSSYPQYPSFLHIELCYDAQGAEETGYQSRSSYVYALDDYWYIHIYA